MLSSIVISVIVALIYFKIIKTYKYWKKKGVPYVKPQFIFGNMAPNFFRTKALGDLVVDLYNAYPDQRYVGIWHFLQPTLIIRDLELIKRITVKDFDSFPDHRVITSGDADPLASKNLFNLTGAQGWHDMRSTLSPAFTSSKMRAMFVLMDKCADQFVNHFLQQNNNLITIELKSTFTKFTNDVIGTTAFGVTCNSLENQNNEFYRIGKDLTDFSGLRVLKVFAPSLSPALMKIFKIKLFSKQVNMSFRSLVKEAMCVREQNQIVRPDMIHLLMEAKAKKYKNQNSRPIATFTDDDITAQALFFFFAGFDTTATLISLAIYELAVNPDVQTKLMEEISENCKNGITYEAIIGMKYLDGVVSETLRKWPPVLFLDRKCAKPFTIEPELPGEHPVHLEKDSVIWIPSCGIHMDPNYYPKPEKFDPERFNAENKCNIKPFSFLPFGTGPRNCIGSRFVLLETKLLIVKLLQNFDLVPVKKTEIPLKMGKNTFSPLPDNGLWIGLQRRSAI